jgi:hypothetical protein
MDNPTSMDIPTRSIPSMSYFGSQAGGLANQAVSRLQGAFDKIREAIHSIGRAAHAASYGLRQEVPFERWFFDHGFQKPIDKLSPLIKAHLWAVLAAGEGTVRTSAESAAYVFSLVFDRNHRNQHLDVLKAQWQGLTLSLLAILSPNAAKRRADNHGDPLIGCSIFNWKWGTLYSGKLDVPLWRVECKQYPWADRPA